MMEPAAEIECDELEKFFEDFCLENEVPRIKGFIDALDFYRDFVSPSRPCVIEGGCDDWPALKKWTNSYLKSLDIDVTVAATPDGWADAIRDDKFCLPQEGTMKMSDFIDKIEKPSEGEVLYIQKQNSNLDTELTELWKDTSPILRKWGEQVFGTAADASNFWMGDTRAITSMHKDHYENLYCVIRGYKTFTLCPPYSCMRIPHKSCKNFTHKKHEDGRWTLDPTEGETVWASGDPRGWSGVKTVKVVVKQGDVLYLPSLWFHQVEQSHQCIAVNHWFDMRFDLKYCYFKMAEQLNPSLRRLLKTPTDR